MHVECLDLDLDLYVYACMCQHVCASINHDECASVCMCLSTLTSMCLCVCLYASVSHLQSPQARAQSQGQGRVRGFNHWPVHVCKAANRLTGTNVVVADHTALSSVRVMTNSPQTITHECMRLSWKWRQYCWYHTCRNTLRQTHRHRCTKIEWCMGSECE